MNNEQVVETMIVSGKLRYTNDGLLEQLKRSNIDILYTWNKIENFLKSVRYSNDIEITCTRCTIRLSTLNDRHNLGMNFREFLDKFLEIYKLRYSDKLLSGVVSLENDIVSIDKNGTYDINLDEFRIVENASCIVKKDRSSIMVASDNIDGVAVFRGFEEKMTCGYMIKGSEEIAFVCKSAKEECDMILSMFKEKPDVIFLPSLTKNKWRLLNACEKENLTNKEFIRFLRLIGAIRITSAVDLRRFKNIEESTYNIRDIFVKLIRLNSYDIKRIMMNLEVILEAKDLSQEKINELNDVLGVQLDFIHKSSLVDIDTGKSLSEMIRQIENIK